MRSRDLNKDFEIFDALNTIELQLDASILEKAISKLQNAQTKFSPKDKLRGEVKKNVNSLKSIHSALLRGYDSKELLSDLSTISLNLKNIFAMFKLSTGVHTVHRKEKQKKEKMDSLLDLEFLLKPKQEFEQEEKLDNVNLLSFLKDNCQKDLAKGYDITFMQMPLIVQAKVDNSSHLANFGVLVQNTKFGPLWSNQYLVAVKRSSKYTLEFVKEKLEAFYRMPFEIPYHSLNNNFPDYIFYWAIPKTFFTELGFFRVYSFSLPFENKNETGLLKEGEKSIKELRAERILKNNA